MGLGPAIAAVLLAVSAANPALDEGRELFRKLEFKAAEGPLERARKHPDSTVAERREAHDLLARVYAAHNQIDLAEKVYYDLLAQDAHAPPPRDVSPKISDAFHRAKSALYPPNHVDLNRINSGGRHLLHVRVVDPWKKVSRVVVRKLGAGRPGSEVELSLSEHEAQSDFSAKPYGEYIVEARSNDGTVLASLGSVEQPLAFGVKPVKLAPAPVVEAPAPVPAPAVDLSERPSRAKAIDPKWVPWALAGASVVAGIAGTVFAVSSNQDALAAAGAHFASDTRALDARAHRKAVASNVLFGGALLSGGAAGYLFWRWQ